MNLKPYPRRSAVDGGMTFPSVRSWKARLSTREKYWEE